MERPYLLFYSGKGCLFYVLGIFSILLIPFYLGRYFQFGKWFVFALIFAMSYFVTAKAISIDKRLKK